MIIYKNTKAILENNGITTNEETYQVFLALVEEMSRNCIKKLISFDTIYCMMTGNFNSTVKVKRRYCNKYIEALKEMDGKIINLINVKKDCAYIDFTILQDMVDSKDLQFYITVSSQQLQNMYADNDCKSILTYLIYLLEPLTKQIYINPDIDSIVSETKLNKRTVLKYNGILENEEILYIYHYGLMYLNSNKMVNNMYGVYDSKATMDEYAEIFIDANSHNLKAVSPYIKRAASENITNNSNTDDDEETDESSLDQFDSDPF